MTRDLDREAAIIINDLDSIVHRIYMLGPLQSFNSAVEAVDIAKRFMETGQLIIRRRIEEEESFNNRK